MYVRAFILYTKLEKKKSKKKKKEDEESIDPELRAKKKQFPGLSIPDDKERIEQLIIIPEEDKNVADNLMSEVIN